MPTRSLSRFFASVQKVLVAGLLALTGGLAFGQIANSGFETGSLSSWSKPTVLEGAASSDEQVVSGASSVDNSGKPGATSAQKWFIYPSGGSMARLSPSGSCSSGTMQTDLALGLVARTLFTVNYALATNTSYIAQDVHMNAGDTITMAWNYVATDYSPFNDSSIATFVDMSNALVTGQITIGAYSQVTAQYVGLGSTVADGNYIAGNYGSTGWQTITFKATATGTWRIGFAVYNITDNSNSPVLFVDNAAGSTYSGGPAGTGSSFGPIAANGDLLSLPAIGQALGQTVPTINWSAPTSITYGTALSATQLNATSTTPGTMTYFPVSGTVLGAGNQTLSVTLTPTDLVTYTSTTGVVTLTVNKANPTVTWSAPASITVGTPIGATQLNATASVPGSFSYSPAQGSLPAVGTTSLGVTFTPTDTTDYNTVTASVNLGVQAAALLTQTITFPTIPTQTFGGASVNLAATSSTGLGIGYTVVSGPATVTGNILTFTGAGTVVVSASQGGNSLYASASVPQTITVNKGTPTITWPAPASITLGTTLSSTQLDATANVPGAFVYTPAVGANLALGSHSLGVVFTPTDTTDYTTASASVNLIVNAVALPAATITWAAPTAITFGTALSGTQLNATANVPGTLTYTPGAGTILLAGPNTLSVTFVPTDLTSYSVSTASVSLTVNKGTPVITWATPASIPLGTALDGTQLNATANVAGTFVYSPSAGTVPPLGTTTLNVTFTPLDSIDYVPATASVNLNVSAAALQSQTINFPTIAAPAFGTTSVNLSATASSGLAVTFSVVSGPGSISGHTLTITGTGGIVVAAAQAGNSVYASASASQTIIVSKGTPVITWATPAAITAGTALSSTQLNATANVAGTFAYTPIAGSIPLAGTQSLSVTFVPTDATDYNAVTASVNLTVGYSTPVITGFTPDTGVVGDHITSATILTLSGTGQPSTTVIVADGASILGTTMASATGAWTYTTGTLTLGLHTFTAVSRDNSGNQSSASVAFLVTVSGVVGTAPSVLGFSPDTGTVGDGKTSATVLTFNGTSVAGTTVTLWDGSTQLGSTSTNSGGQWSVATPTLAAGVHSFVGSITDIVGNQINSPAFPVTIVTAPPAISAPGSVSISAPLAVDVSTATTTPLSVSDANATTMTVTLGVPEGGLNLASTHGAILTVGTGSNDLTESLTGTVAQVNAALAAVTYMPTASGQPLSMDVLSVDASSDVGLTAHANINIFTTREVIGGGVTTVSLTPFVPLTKKLVSDTITQWDPTQLLQAPVLSADGTVLSFIPADGQDGSVTYTTITVVMTYSDGTTATDVIPLTIYHPTLTILDSTNSPTNLNPQTSFYEQSVKITNTTPTPLVSFTLSIPSLPSGVSLESASGYDTNGIPFITGIAAIAPGASTTFTLEYFSVNAKPFVNPYVKLQEAASTVLPTVTGAVGAAPTVVTAYAGREYVEFPSVSGTTYWIQYRDSATANWQTSYIPVLGDGDTVFWMDNGAPKTNSAPTKSRTYQILISSNSTH